MLAGSFSKLGASCADQPGGRGGGHWASRAAGTPGWEPWHRGSAPAGFKVPAAGGAVQSVVLWHGAEGELSWCSSHLQPEIFTKHRPSPAEWRPYPFGHQQGAPRGLGASSQPSPEPVPGISCRLCSTRAPLLCTKDPRRRNSCSLSPPSSISAWPSQPGSFSSFQSSQSLFFPSWPQQSPRALP